MCLPCNIPCKFLHKLSEDSNTRQCPPLSVPWRHCGAGEEPWVAVPLLPCCWVLARPSSLRFLLSLHVNSGLASLPLALLGAWGQLLASELPNLMEGPWFCNTRISDHLCWGKTPAGSPGLGARFGYQKGPDPRRPGAGCWAQSRESRCLRCPRPGAKAPSGRSQTLTELRPPE